MKVTVEIDCTAQEARELLGLPNVQELQNRWLEKVGGVLMGNPENFSADQLIQNWTKAAAGGLDIMPDMIQTFMKTALSGKK